MRNIDLRKSRDYYKETLDAALEMIVQMAKSFESAEKHYRERICKLERRNDHKTP